MSDQRPTPGGGLTCDEVRDLAAPFVLDALDADEVEAVRDHLASCAEPHPEVQELADVVPVLAESVPLVEPPPALKDRIMAAAAAEAPAPAVTRAPAVAAVPAPPTPIDAGGRRGRSFGTWLVGIAAGIAIVALLGWNVLLQAQLTQSRSYADGVAAVLRVASQPGSLTALLTPQGAATATGLASVDVDGRMTMAVRDLAPTTGTEVYTAWVIGGDGTPRSLGDVRPASDGSATLVAGGLPSEPGMTLALTLEPTSGQTAPSGPVVSAGAANPTGSG